MYLHKAWWDYQLLVQFLWGPTTEVSPLITHKQGYQVPAQCSAWLYLKSHTKQCKTIPKVQTLEEGASFFLRFLVFVWERRSPGFSDLQYLQYAFLSLPGMVIIHSIISKLATFLPYSDAISGKKLKELMITNLVTLSRVCSPNMAM